MGDNIRRTSIIAGLEGLRRSLQSFAESSTQRQPNRGGESGAEYIHRLLTENPMRCQEQLRLDKDMFVKLVNLMVERNLLEDGRYITVAEQVGICLYILARGDSYRGASDKFKAIMTKLDWCHFLNDRLHPHQGNSKEKCRYNKLMNSIQLQLDSVVF